MKVSIFQQAPYRYLPKSFAEEHDSVVTTPYRELVDPELMQESLVSSYAELMHAARVGFDGIAVTEHSQSSYDVSPNPNLTAAALAYATEAEGLDVAITVLGRSLGKTREPLRVAEEYAMLDNITGGRFIAGFPVGLSYDANQNAGIPPIDTRARYREHRELVLKAWTEDEPFAWNGKYEKYGQVNIWPRPVQTPHPPIWIPSTGSPGSLKDIVEANRALVYMSWVGPKLVGRGVFDRYWKMIEERNMEPNPYRLAFLQVVAVSETDEQAEADFAEHLESHYRSGLGAAPGSSFGLPGYIEPAGLEHMARNPGGGAGGLLEGRMSQITYEEIIDSQLAIVGSPETVADAIEKFVREFRIGNLLVMLQNGSMPRELTEKSMSLFAERVLPRLRPIWDDEGWENEWWPESLRTSKVTVAQEVPR